MITLEFTKKVNPNLLLEELVVVDEEIRLTTHGEHLIVTGPDTLGQDEIDEIGDIVESHDFISLEDYNKEKDKALQQEFDEATDIETLKGPLKKKFGWE